MFVIAPRRRYFVRGSATHRVPLESQPAQFRTFVQHLAQESPPLFHADRYFIKFYLGVCGLPGRAIQPKVSRPKNNISLFMLNVRSCRLSLLQHCTQGVNVVGHTIEYLRSSFDLRVDRIVSARSCNSSTYMDTLSAKQLNSNGNLGALAKRRVARDPAG